MGKEKMKMKIHSIFPSINGEVSALGQGSICTFIRLQGCNLRCSYCDTKQAQDKEKGIKGTPRDIYRKVQSLGIQNVTITGGEPFLQETELLRLLKMLYMGDYVVSIETNGSLYIHRWNYIKSVIADWKLPSSNMYHHMNIQNFEKLTKEDYVKFVISTREDFDKATKVMQALIKRAKIYFLHVPRFAFSPLKIKNYFCNERMLAEWMLNDKTCKKVNAIYNLQIHKIINVS